MNVKIARVLGSYTRVPTLADDSGIIHAIVYAVNPTYRDATLRERCMIVHRFRNKLADVWVRKPPPGFVLREQHEDTFETHLRSYDGVIDADAVDFISAVLRVNIVLLHLPHGRMLRRSTDAVHDDTIIVGWDQNWATLRLAQGCVLHTPGGRHAILHNGT